MSRHRKEPYTPTESDEEALQQILSVIRRYGLTREGVEHVLRVTATFHAIDFPKASGCRERTTRGGDQEQQRPAMHPVLELLIGGPIPAPPSADDVKESILSAVPEGQERDALRKELDRKHAICVEINAAAREINCPGCHLKLSMLHSQLVSNGKQTMEEAKASIAAAVKKHAKDNHVVAAVNGAADEFMRGMELAGQAKDALADADPGNRQELKEAAERVLNEELMTPPPPEKGGPAGPDSFGGSDEDSHYMNSRQGLGQ